MAIRLLLRYAKTTIRYALIALARMGTRAEIEIRAKRRFQLRNAIPANKTPTTMDDVKYRIPLHASAIFQSPEGVDKTKPSCTAGIPENRSAFTVNAAVNRWRGPTRLSPAGTAKKRNKRAKRKMRTDWASQKCPHQCVDYPNEGELLDHLDVGNIATDPKQSK